jgi:hypothetical protein
MIVAEVVIDFGKLSDVVIIAIVYVALETICLCKFKEELFALSFKSLLGSLKWIGKELTENGPSFICALVVGFPIVFALITTLFSLHAVFLNPNPIGDIIAAFCLAMFMIVYIVFSALMNRAKIVPWLSTRNQSTEKENSDN